MVITVGPHRFKNIDSSDICIYMKPLFNIDDLYTYKPSQLLSFQCEFCNDTFQVEARFVKNGMKRPKQYQKYCSIKCQHKSMSTSVEVPCGQCKKQIKVWPKVIKNSKSGNVFCSQSCAATYNNTHKKTGYRRSKLEKWIEKKLTEDFSSLNVLYNDKETINSELDIYFPELKLAVELNGIFHYEPIYGKEKLASTQNNDDRKFQACIEQGIELIIIDVSKFSYFKPDRAMPYYKIIKDIVISKTA